MGITAVPVRRTYRSNPAPIARVRQRSRETCSTNLVSFVSHGYRQNIGKKMGARTCCGSSFSCPYFLATAIGEHLSYHNWLLYWI
jgi:hypothetical protein